MVTVGIRENIDRDKWMKGIIQKQIMTLDDLRRL